MTDIYYEPNESENLSVVLDTTEYNNYVKQIEATRLTEKQKEFLKLAATRFIRFKYEKIADYYISTTPEMREWIEKLHLVVVDYDSAIKNGYIKFQEDYKNLVKEIIDEK